jgi:hypothetical protein
VPPTHDDSESALPRDAPSTGSRQEPDLLTTQPLPRIRPYVYDPDAPRHAQLRTYNVGYPAATVGFTDTGSYAVIADPSTSPHLLGHALDYADRLAELIPDQRVPEVYVGKHRATP